MGERRGTKALELWCRRMTEGYPGVKIDNMTTSWRDGLAFCAMIHHFRPDLIEFDKLNKEDVYYNNELAFTTAEKYLGIPALLDADDMANYEVPDRLSILTYLSQYYQVFAAQDSPNRLKRPSSSNEKSQISKPAGPPSKMAHVVGVPRRDPCQKCQLPVFLAERMTVGKKIFHRTCLKCARCGSQLAIGSFYETEDDDVFCCETCPDEEEFEENLNNPTSSNSNSILRSKETTPTRTVRSSIADRLAFFEQSKTNTDNEPGSSNSSSNKLLQKSVSDEEKSKSLQATPVETKPYKMNTALSSFLNDTIDGEDPETEDSSELSSFGGTRNEKHATPMETSDTEDSDDSEHVEKVTNLLHDQIPELPKSQPPIDNLKEEKKEPNKRFTTTADLQLFIDNSSNETNKPDNSELSNLDTTSLTIKSNNNYHEPEITNSAEDVTEAHKSQITHKSEHNLDVSASNINESVTKDKNADTIQAPAEDAVDEIVELRPKSATNSPETTHLEDRATTERLSVVRARLQQFEEITNNNNNFNDNNTNVKSQRPENDNLIHENTNEQIKLDINDDVDTDVDVGNDTAADKTSSTVKVIESDAVDIKNEEPESMLQKIHNDEVVAITEIKKPTPSPRQVSKHMETKDEVLDNKEPGTPEKIQETEQSIVLIESAKPLVISSPTKTPSKSKTDDYPEDLNPFKSDDEDDEIANKENNTQGRLSISKRSEKSEKSENSNPFDSSDDEIELEKSYHSTTSGSMSKMNSVGKIRPPRPPPPRISRNPFDEDDDDEQNFSRHSSLTSSAKIKTPVPTPRTNLSQSQNPTPEATPRLSQKTTPHSLGLNNSSDYYGSINSLGATTPLHRNSDIRGSNNSLTSSSGGTVRSRKNRKAPAPPQPPTVKELFPSTETLGSSKTSTPSSSTVGSPKLSRKKRPAPAPPKPARLESSLLPQITHDHEINGSGSKNLHSYPLQSGSESKLSDEEKALLEGKTDLSSVVLRNKNDITQEQKLAAVSRRNSRRLIPLDPALLKDAAENAHEAQCDDQKQQQLIDQDEHNVVYRRVIMPQCLSTPTHERNPLIESLHSQDRQSEKLKDNKEAKNRNRQSQQSASSGAEDADTAIYNKQAHGKWKRRKGPAPALPVPPRKVLQMLPLQEIRHELEIIETQQQGLEKQGVVLEKMIRDRCEGQSGELLNNVGVNSLSGAGDGIRNNSEGVQNSKEVEDLILQLFELVNEKNELFRRQAELMYLRRQHRLEQEQADLEYEIRVLMAQPERNKTDSDKAREEALIARLVEVVQLRNEVVECLEMDRLREAEEDLSIKQRLELHNAKRDGINSDDSSKKNSSKLSKKEKKKQKEAKKLSKNKKIDADKDADETELTTDKQKLKKKKRKFLF